MLDILGLGEEVERGGNGKGPGSIISTSLTIDGYYCGLAVSRRPLQLKDVACRAIA